MAGCSDQPVATTPAVRASASVAIAPAAHLVVFRNERGIPDDFAAQVGALGGSVDAAYAGLGIATVSGLSEQGVATLRGHGGVAFVETDASVAFDAGVRRAGPLEEMIPDVSTASTQQPHFAPLYRWQWNMQAISARTAWEAGYLGSPDVTVAILDTGIDPTVLDAEGLVDLERSRSFVPEDDAALAALYPGLHPISDLDGHGTNVALQVSSNARHFAGVTSRSTLMGVKVCSVYGYCRIGATLAGIVYAVDAGADVINMSLGGSFLRRDCAGCGAIVDRVLRYAESNGVTVVVAAGNEATDLDRDGGSRNTFCGAPHVICVAATGATDAGFRRTGPFINIDSPAPYTNFGRSAISVAAPGGSYSLNADGSIRTQAPVYSDCSRTARNYNRATGQLEETYCSINAESNPTTEYLGTSQASAHVAGLAALLVERHGRNPARIRQTIQASADQLGSSGNDPYYGRGRINVARALGL
ncbi:MAG TPA: S8 family serine peptidase [Longimicrobium sp.]